MDTCYVDTETTSLIEPWKLGGRRTWEAALIRVAESGQIVDAAWLQITDLDLSNADPKSLELGNFWQRWKRVESYGMQSAQLPVDGAGRIDLDRCDTAKAALRIEELTRGAVLAGSNAGFDKDNFALMLEGELQPATWYHHPRDIPNIALGWLRASYQAQAAVGEHERGDGWTGNSYPTSVLSEACGVPVPADRHSAWADAVWMLEWDARMRGLTLSV